MKRALFIRLFILLGMVVIAVRMQAQHFISIQSESKQPFAIQVNGIAFNSTKTGAVRISNLAGGSYNLLINPGKKTAPQAFTVAIDKSDASYLLKSDVKQGWLLKNTKSTEVIASSTPQTPAGQAVAKNNEQPAPKASPFATMLSEVIGDPDLLKTTPWVLTNKAGDAAGNAVANVPEEEQVVDTVAYVPETKGVIKAVEQTVKEGTELVFVDFTATGGDTIHIVIPSTGDGDSDSSTSTLAQHPADNNKLVQADTSTAQKVVTPPAEKDNTVIVKDTAMVMGGQHDSVVTPAKEEPVAFDTSSNKQMSNPFFNKDGIAKKNTDNNAVNNGNVEKPLPAENKEEVKPATKPLNAVKQDCKKMLSDNDADKLKHKIYLEMDDSKVLALTEKALNGKCVSTAQVKEMASLFLSDAARYNFFRTVYPYVYDYGNFGTLENFMIDRKYKGMFHDLLK